LIVRELWQIAKCHRKSVGLLAGSRAEAVPVLKTLHCMCANRNEHGTYTVPLSGATRLETGSR